MIWRGHSYTALGKSRWMANDPLPWRIGGPRVDHLVTIPARRAFDSSVPWWATWLISRNDPRFLLAARVHDYLLEEGYGRAQAAAEWYDGALAGGAPKGLAKLAYIGVAVWAVLKPEGK